MPPTLVINNLTPEAVAESTHELVRRIRESQIVMLPGGFSGGDEPDGSAKFITAFFRAPEVTEAVRDLLQARDGLMLGICNGFQALIKLGLVPYGDIRPMDETCPTLTFNTIGRHQSTPGAHARGVQPEPLALQVQRRATCTPLPSATARAALWRARSWWSSLAANGQIATQYVDAERRADAWTCDVNPNGSVLAVEGITSPDGRVLGKMGHTERSGDGPVQERAGQQVSAADRGRSGVTSRTSLRGRPPKARGPPFQAKLRFAKSFAMEGRASRL